MWDEAGDTELLSLESALLMEVASPPTVAVAFPPPFEGINPALPEETMTSPEAVAMQDDADGGLSLDSNPRRLLKVKYKV